MTIADFFHLMERYFTTCEMVEERTGTILFAHQKMRIYKMLEKDYTDAGQRIGPES